MLVGTVVGKVWATKKEESLEGLPLLVIRPFTTDGRNSAETLVAVDPLGAGIGERVLVPQHLRGIELPDDERRAASQWHASGLRPLSSKEAPDGGAEAPLVLPAAMECNLLRPDGLNAEEGYLACRNFDVLKRYNASTLYAISVAELADGLESSDVLERVPL